jgi:Domain of unknown function (DUF5666)
MSRGEGDMKTSLAQWMVSGLLAFLLLGLGGCGGGGGGNYAGGGIGGSGISVGAITAIGSIDVNGVKFDTSSAAIFVGGDKKGVGDQVVRNYLHTGQVVVVEGTVNEDDTTGSATNVYFDANVAGSVESDPAAGEFRVLGQLVTCDSETVFDGYASFDDVKRGDVVEVSGLGSGSGAIQATYVARKPSLAEQEVKGVVQDLNTVARTFSIGNLTVEYDDTTELPDGKPEEEQLVQVKGTLQSKGKLEATRIQFAREARIVDAERMDIEGLVTEVITPSEFRVSYLEVQWGGETQFKNGTPADITLGANLEVRGRLEHGVLVARKITFAKK